MRLVRVDIAMITCCQFVLNVQWGMSKARAHLVQDQLSNHLGQWCWCWAWFQQSPCLAKMARCILALEVGKSELPINLGIQALAWSGPEFVNHRHWGKAVTFDKAGGGKFFFTSMVTNVLSADLGQMIQSHLACQNEQCSV